MYFEIKRPKMEKRALACAVCLSEFEDNKELCLLPHIGAMSFTWITLTSGSPPM
ncbi:hypothetical protein MUK42_09686 [Musa troglodytarum]|uniref:Uncharacterized protein n=1 Tax=Musa troglodytarum TaxID=320322 RepID=A0A9E7EGF5_9LILI|nr:hypothetical protein MUK42_09686 [Musa troglodytarum]